MIKGTEIELNEFKIEIKNIIKNFDESIHATLGDTVTVISDLGKTMRKATLQDAIDLYRGEWYNTLESLSELGIYIE